MDTMDKSQNHIMIDIETLGTKPQTDMMVELAAVRFDPETFEPMDEGFYTRLSLAKTRKIDPVTLNWWAKTIPNRLIEYLNEAPTAPFPERAMGRFYDYAVMNKKTKQVYPKAWLWAKPTSFDVSFVYSYMEEFTPRESYPKIWNLFSRRRAIDVRSYMAGRGFNTEKLKSYTPPGLEDAHHDPMFDCLEQIYTIRRNLIKSGLIVEGVLNE